MKKTNLTPNNSTVIHDQHTICGLICELNRNDQSGVLHVIPVLHPLLRQLTTIRTNVLLYVLERDADGARECYFLIYATD